MNTLPERPDLDYEKKQAKALLKACRDGDSAAVGRMRTQLHRLTSTGATPPTLADAQFVIAREYGFESWPKLKMHIESLRPLDEVVVPFLRAARSGKLTVARRLLAQHPTLTSHFLRPMSSWQPACAEMKRGRARSFRLWASMSGPRPRGDPRADGCAAPAGIAHEHGHLS